MSAGQHLMVGFSPEEEEEILGLVSEEGIGGLILFSRNGEDAMDVARLCTRIWQATRVKRGARPPIISLDQEQGRVCRVKQGVTRFPGASALGRIDRPGTTESVARWVARELRALGIHLNLAPVADVPSRDHPPEILQGRVFGFEPGLVARHVRAWIRGSQGEAVAACAKHFPGHGSVREDSHVVMPRDATSWQEMERIHLRPFSSAIRAGAAAIMVNHICYESLDPEAPASFSPSVVDGLLRGKMGFDGLIITDDLEMAAVGSLAEPAEASIRALAAGADMAVVGRNLKGEIGIRELIQDVDRAARRGRISREQMRGAASRIERFRRRWIPSHWEPPAWPPASLKARRLANRLWVLGDRSG